MGTHRYIRLKQLWLRPFRKQLFSPGTGCPSTVVHPPLQGMLIQVPARLRCKMEHRTKTKHTVLNGVTSVQPYKRLSWHRRELSGLQHTTGGVAEGRNIFIHFHCQRKQTLDFVLLLCFYVAILSLAKPKERASCPEFT